MRETWVRSLGQEDSLEKEMATHSSTLAWKFPGQRSLVGYSPWGRKESDTIERLHSLTHIPRKQLISLMKLYISLYLIEIHTNGIIEVILLFGWFYSLGMII